MAKKERNKRSARKARAQERAEREAAREASSASSSKSSATSKQASSKQAQASSETKPAKAKKKPGRIRTYFKAVKAEMHRVVWPSKKELKNYSIAVTVALIVFGVCVWLVDTGVVALLVAFTGLRG